jgi:hypothetical protein
MTMPRKRSEQRFVRGSKHTARLASVIPSKPPSRSPAVLSQTCDGYSPVRHGPHSGGIVPKKRRASISLRGSAFYVSRLASKHAKCVYVFVASRPHKYATGTSRVVYIGTTRKGLRRLVDSAFDRSGNIFDWGVRSFEAFVLTCRPRQRVRMWLKLERAMLTAFRERYGSYPKANANVKKPKEDNAFEYFSRRRANRLLDTLSRRSLPRGR